MNGTALAAWLAAAVPAGDAEPEPEPEPGKGLWRQAMRAALLKTPSKPGRCLSATTLRKPIAIGRAGSLQLFGGTAAIVNPACAPTMGRPQSPWWTAAQLGLAWSPEGAQWGLYGAISSPSLAYSRSQRLSGGPTYGFGVFWRFGVRRR